LYAIASKSFRTGKRFRKKFSIQMSTLIAVSRLISMEANYETKKRKEQQ
jgi:hypothetical protein